MFPFNRIFLLASCLSMALAAVGAVAATGCGAADHADPAAGSVAIDIRVQGDPGGAAAGAPPHLRMRDGDRLVGDAPAGPAPDKFSDVTRILVDITLASSGQAFYSSLDLTEISSTNWHGDVPALPRNQQLHFVARALDAAGTVAFSGETLATLTIDAQGVTIPLAPAQNGATLQLPQLVRLNYPREIFSGQREQFAFTIQGNAGQTIGLSISPLAAPGTPSADFTPATGSVTLNSSVADFVALYTAPTVTADTPFDYQVTISSASTTSAVAVTTNFETTIKLKPANVDTVVDTAPTVQFAPVISSLAANGSAVPGAIQLAATVSDDSTPDHLSFQWSYAPNLNTPDATFADSGQNNPEVFQGYTAAHQGVITLAVTDENHATTTLHYQLVPGEFANVIDHGPVNAIRRIVAGDNHTCVLTSQNTVRCWGDNAFGQLGYGNTTDVGDVPARLPSTAGDVPLPPLDPVLEIAAGYNHTCALLQSGLVVCWGLNNFGQLGYGNTNNIGDGEAVTAAGYVTLGGGLATHIAAGGDSTCAIMKTSGTLRCWGRNDFGQLGRGNTSNIGDNETVASAGEVDLGTGIAVKDMALGGQHMCALLTNGALRCWGRGDSAQLGIAGNTSNIGDNESIATLANIPLTGTVRKVVAGDSHTCALTDASTVRCWGRNVEGELGQPIGNNNLLWGDGFNETPLALPGDVNATAPVNDIVSGRAHVCVLSTDSKIRCWGFNQSGQLGNGNIGANSGTPTGPVNLDGVTPYAMAGGGSHTCALRANGTARCWGLNNNGQLGRGNTTIAATATGAVDVQIFAPNP